MTSFLTRLPTPSFWYDARASARAMLLRPLGRLYAMAHRQRLSMYHPVPMARPVICVGNAVAGGAGKTPLVVALVKLMQESGWNPHIVSRGYGGREPGPLQVSPGRDTAEDVGDEPLLLVEAAPTWIARNRPLGVQAAIDTGATAVVMDDGYQNPVFYKDFSILVLDGMTGLGNGMVMPAGPLREDFAGAVARADAVVLIGEDRRDLTGQIARLRPELPVYTARITADAGAPDVAGKTVYAFAGIARPEKFRLTLQQAGAEVEGWAEFPDHYPYEEEDLRELMASAAEKSVPVYTTVKDHVRLPPALRENVQPYAVSLALDDAAGLLAQIETVLADRRKIA